MSIPEFMLKFEGFEQSLWIHEQDCVFESNNNSFDQQNQMDWWKKNVEIRKAFELIEQEIRHIKKNKNKIPKRIISWVRIAELAQCDRATLRHPKRESWTKERFDFLSSLINNSNESNIIDSGINDQEKVQKNLAEQVIKSRNETIKWIGRLKVLEEENKALTRLLKHKENEIIVKERKIMELNERLRVQT
jgi:hypothetical protein